MRALGAVDAIDARVIETSTGQCALHIRKHRVVGLVMMMSVVVMMMLCAYLRDAGRSKHECGGEEQERERFHGGVCRLYAT